MPEIEIVENIMSVNDQVAAEVLRTFDQHHILALNVMASPGGGKTSTIMKTIERHQRPVRVGVMDGDVVMIDVDSIAQLGIPVALVNTGGDCHLDANMIRSALPTFDLNALDLLIIENVGNLICPAALKLGVHLNVVIASVPEGADKPYKYPDHVQGRGCAAAQQNGSARISGLRSGLLQARRRSAESRRGLLPDLVPDGRRLRRLDRLAARPKSRNGS